MEIRLLRNFQAIARCQGLTTAAAELHVTPSALSHGLKSLEGEVGCRLFERVGSRLLLNQAGEQLLAGIERPLQALEDAAASMKQLNRWAQGRLRIGVAVTACQHLLPSVLRELRREHDRLQILVETGDMPHLATLLREQRIDLAIGVELEEAPDLEQHALFEDELLFVVAAKHRWAEGHPLKPEEIRAQSLILYRRSSQTGQLVTQYLRDHRIEPIVTMEVGSVAAIKEMVRLNLGIAVLAPWVLEAELNRRTVVTRPLGTRGLRRRWVLAHLAGRRLNLAEERFSRLCRGQATGLRKDRRDLPAR